MTYRPGDPITVTLEEAQRQATVMALAHLAVARPGWDHMLTEIAAKMDNPDLGMYKDFKTYRESERSEEYAKIALGAGEE